MLYKMNMYILEILSYNWPCERETWKWQERKAPYWIFQFYRPATGAEQRVLTAKQLRDMIFKHFGLNVERSTVLRA